MKTMSIAIISGAALALSACGMGAESTPVPLTEKQAKQLDKEISGKVAGKSVDCITQHASNNLIRISDDTLLYRSSGRLVYMNKLRWSCPGLARDNDILVVESFGSQLCSGDHVRLVDRVSGIQGPSCVLGEFVPYRKEPAA